MNDYVNVLKSGQRYLRLWPRERSLFAIFPESRIVLALEWAVRIVPAIVFCSLFLQMQVGHPSLWPVVCSTLLVMLLLVFQGYYWLGIRAETRLPPSLSRWYAEINQKMGKETAERRPRYMELAETLGLAFKKLDNSFLYH